MLPDGQKFFKPLKLTAKYTDEEIERAIPEALRIAYQNAERVWMSVGGVELDEANRKVSIEVDHFSENAER